MSHPSLHTPASSPPKPRRRDPKGTRERLVRAALELFTTQGYHASTTPQIARRAGVAEGTIYRHFESKEQLLNDIYRAAVKFFGRIVTEAPANTSCREHVANIAATFREVASKDPGLVKLVFVSPPRALLNGQSQEAFQEFRGALEKVLASGKASGEIRPGPVEVWTDVWLRLITLVLERVADREWGPEHTAPRLAEESAWDAIAARTRVPQTGAPGARADLPRDQRAHGPV